MGKYDVKSYATIIFLSFALVTILNVLLHAAFPDIPIIKTGFGLILLLISIVLIMLFSFASDGKFEKEEIYAILVIRSEEHTSELQSRLHLVCRLLLEKK